MGQRPVVVEASIGLDEGDWNSTVFVDNHEGFAVPSFVLCNPESARAVAVFVGKATRHINVSLEIDIDRGRCD